MNKKVKEKDYFKSYDPPCGREQGEHFFFLLIVCPTPVAGLQQRGRTRQKTGGTQTEMGEK